MREKVKMCKMAVTRRFAAKKENGRSVVVNPEEVVDLHQDGDPDLHTFHIVKGKHRGATFSLCPDDPRNAKLVQVDHLDAL